MGDGSAQLRDFQHIQLATEQARTIVYLQYINLVICLGFALTVGGLLTYAIIKFRHRAGDGEPIQHEGNTKLEITWDGDSSVDILISRTSHRLRYAQCQSSGGQNANRM